MAGSISDKDQAELQEFIQMEQQKALFQTQIHRLMDLCWEQCMDSRPRDKLDYKTENCFTNCTERFVDTSLVITNRFQQMLQQKGGH